MLRRAVLALLALVPLWAPGAAQAAGPGPRAQQDAGLRITWPLTAPTATVAPGTVVLVKVRTLPRRRAKPAQLTFLDGARVIALATLRRGTFIARVPDGAGKRYVLDLRIGNRIWQGVVLTPPAAGGTTNPVGIRPGATRPPGTPTTPAQDDTGPDTVTSADPFGDPPPCVATGPAAGTLTLAAAQVKAGETTRYTITATGGTCLMVGLTYTLERRVGDAWTPVPLDLAFPAITYRVDPTRRWANAMTVPSDAAPGRWRMSTSVMPEPRTGPALVLTATFDVMPA